jgi:ATP-binding cassette subfamily F protein 3
MNAQIVLENLGIHLPNRVLFEDVNFTIYDGMRVSLAGRNGSGKSTLMRILGGKAEASVGKCNFVGGKKLRVGFLDQSLLDSAVLEAVNSNDTGLTPITYILKQLEKSRFDQEREPDEYEWKIRKILSGLGFSKAWMENPLSSLSGGWLLRVFIAASLVDKPEVLLLDEPTNHLDISSIQWLEEFLQKDYEGSLILITHDISLQKRTTDSLAVLHGGRFFFRKGERDYLTFLSSLSDEKRILEKNIEAVQKRIEENMEFVYKFRAKAQTAARAQSKLKAAETLTEELRQLKDRLLRIEGYGYNLKFRFRMAAQGSKFPIAVQKLDFRYAPTTDFILHGVNFDVQRGQCLAILGDNGTGKTTLLLLARQSS